MDDCEFDLIFLRSTCLALCVDPSDDVCPDLEAIADRDAALEAKVGRLEDELTANIRARRRPA